MNKVEFTIITFYQFKKISNQEGLQQILKDLCFFHKIKGTILIANEGINGTLAGLPNSIISLEKKLINLGFKKLNLKKYINK